MPRDDRGPSDEPGRTAHAGDPATARTPPARPDERGTEDERARRIGATKDERTPRPGDRPYGTSADGPDVPDELGGEGGEGGGA